MLLMFDKNLLQIDNIFDSLSPEWYSFQHCQFLLFHPTRILLHELFPIFGTLFGCRIFHLEVVAHSGSQAIGGIQVGRHDGHAE